MVSRRYYAGGMEFICARAAMLLIYIYITSTCGFADALEGSANLKVSTLRKTERNKVEFANRRNLARGHCQNDYVNDQ